MKKNNKMADKFERNTFVLKNLVKENVKNGIVISAGKIELPCADTKVDSMKHESRKPSHSSSMRFGRMIDRKVNSTNKKTPLEERALSKMKNVSDSIMRMKSYSPTQTNMYSMTSEEMKKFSVFDMTSISVAPEYNTFGLFDKRLGCLDRRKMCITCLRTKDCEGHSAFIPLERAYVVPNKQKDVIYDLQCTCEHCGHVYATKEIIKAIGLNKFSGIEYKKNLAKISETLHALHQHDTYTKITYDTTMSDHKVIYRIGNNKQPYSRTIENIKAIFDNYDQNDLEILGYTGKSHPSANIMTGLLTIPPALRRPAYVNETMQNHYITARYIDIIRFNNLLKNNKDMSDADKDQTAASLYSKICEVYFGPENKGKGKGNEQDGALLTAFSGKEGLLRKHAMGKRVDFSVRSVGSPFVDGNREEIGVPKYFAKIVFLKESVTIYNIENFSAKIKSGEIKDIIRIKNGEEITSTISEEGRSKYQLHIGDIVYRPLQNGDVIIFGRQPSLHAFSLIGGKIYLHDDLVIKVPTEVLKGLNLDFDGDEVTIHFLQTIGARVEASTVASTMYHIMNEQSNCPAVGIAFHGLLGSYLATETWNYVTHEEFDEDEFNEKLQSAKTEEEKQILLDQREKIYSDLLKIEREVIIPEERWNEAISLINDSLRKRSLKKRCERHGVKYRSGKALISLSFPLNFCYEDKGLVIKDGILVKGVLKKSNIGTGRNSLVQVIYKMFSLEDANRFINDIMKLADWFIMWHGFSIGQHTFVTNRQEIKQKIKSDINQLQTKIFTLGDKPTNEIDLFFWKKKLHGMIDEVQNLGKKIGNSYLKKSNELNILGTDGAGAKGSYMNTSQITSLLGTQKIKGDIQIPELNDGTRHLVSFLPGDISLESFGYILESFYDGLTPSGMMHHMSSSREGLINTARDTSDIGYTHRRLVKSLEDIIMNQFGMITTTSGQIIKFTYCGIGIQNQVFVESKELGERLSFCDFKNLATMINGLYHFIINERKNSVIKE